MTRAKIAGVAVAIVLVLVALVLAFTVGRRILENAIANDLRESEQSVEPAATSGASDVSSDAATEEDAHLGFLYGRITATDGATYEGRLRFGRGEEAFWSDYFNGFRDENPWAAHAPAEALMERRPLEVFGVEIAQRERRVDLRRPFMTRFGDIARIDVRGRELLVTLKSGTAVALDRYGADDVADGVRVWDGRRGVVDLGERRIRAIEFLPTAPLGEVPDRLHGTVRTRQGDFTGFVQWDRRECVGTDVLEGRTAEGELSLRFDTIRSIARSSGDSALVTLLDGRELALSGTREIGDGNFGIFVDDPRFGRVRVPWGAFERVDFGAGDGSGPAYGDFPLGRPLAGSVTTRAGDRLAGRLVYDLDESETIETLDAPLQGLDYTVLFGLVASIVLPGRDAPATERAVVTLHGGEELQLERGGDLGAGNAGMLIFDDDGESPVYVPWAEVERVDLDRPPAM